MKILGLIVLYYVIAYLFLKKEDMSKWFSPLHPLIYFMGWPIIKLISLFKK